MRICLVTREYPPFTDYSGGIGTQFAALAPELTRQGHETHVITMTPQSPCELDHEGATVHMLERPVPERLWFLEEPAWAARANRAIRRLGRFDIVYAAEYGAEGWRYANRGRSSGGSLVTKLATSVEQIIAISPGWQRWRLLRLRHRIQARLERSQTEHSDALIAPTKAILDWTSELWDIASIRSIVIPNMVDANRVRSIGRDGKLPSGYPEHGPVIAFSGRLEHRKGVLVLARAMVEVWKEFPSAQLVLMGHDMPVDATPMSHQIRNIAGAHANQVHALGNQPPEHLFPALARADLVALPSLWESFGIAALESMALGCATIVTTGSGYDDVFRDAENGLMVSPGDAEALARAIRRLLSDPALAERLGTAAVETIRDRYGVTSVTRKHVEYFASITGGN